MLVMGAASAVASFTGCVGFFLGLAGLPVVTRIFSGSTAAFFTFLGLPGFRFAGSAVGAVEGFNELLIDIWLVEAAFLFLEFGFELIGSELGDALTPFIFLGRPGFLFSGFGSSSFSVFGLPLFTSVRSGFTR